MKTISSWKVALLSLLIAACANQMQPAKQALEVAQSAVEAASANAGKYMPEHLQTLQARLASLKASFDQKDYATVLSTAAPLTSDANTLAQEAASKKADTEKQLAAQWAQLNSAVPGMLDAVKSRVQELEKSKRTAKSAHVTEAKAAFTEASSLWDQATAAHNSGDMTAAVTAAQNAQAKGQSAAEILKLKLPASSVAAK